MAKKIVLALTRREAEGLFCAANDGKKNYRRTDLRIIGSAIYKLYRVLTAETGGKP